ncbi:MAG: hypothetical protein EOO68_38990 [Moraxellaceae bacterium]|nr:MAG: hypothetical protein EOO68_38990 [Moraxellaceae bacterium]
MNIICDADLQYLKPGKKVALKSFNGSVVAPPSINPQENYWKLIGSKAVVSQLSADKNNRVLVTFERDLASLGLICHNETPNALWIPIGDLKFVCRY